MAESCEQSLWNAVLWRAVKDATLAKGISSRDQQAARSFLTRGSKHFIRVCCWAGFDPTWFREKMLAMEAEKWPRIKIPKDVRNHLAD